MSSMAPMIWVIWSDDAAMEDIAASARSITAPPDSAWRRPSLALVSAVCALSAAERMLCDNSSSAAADCSSVAAWRSVRSDMSPDRAATSPALDRIAPAFWLNVSNISASMSASAFRSRRSDGSACGSSSRARKSPCARSRRTAQTVSGMAVRDICVAALGSRLRSAFSSRARRLARSRAIPPKSQSPHSAPAGSASARKSRACRRTGASIPRISAAVASSTATTQTAAETSNSCAGARPNSASCHRPAWARASADATATNSPRAGNRMRRRIDVTCIGRHTPARRLQCRRSSPVCLAAES